MPAPDLAARWNALYTAAIADILDRRGLPTQTLPPGLLIPAALGEDFVGEAEQ